MKRRIQKILGLALSGIIICSSIQANAQTLNEASTNKSKIEAALKETTERIKSLTNDKDSTQSSINDLDRRLVALENESARTNQELATIQARMEETEKSIVLTEEKLAKSREEMAARIVYSYENGRTKMLNLVFSSKSLADVLNALEYSRAVTSFDNQVMEAYSTALTQYNEEKLLLESDEARVAVLLEKSRDQQEEIQSIRAQKGGELVALEGQITDNKKLEEIYQKELTAQNEALARIQQVIAAQKAEQERQEAAKRAERERQEAAERAERERLEAEQQAAAQQAAQQQAAQQQAAQQTPEQSEPQGSGGNVSTPDQGSAQGGNTPEKPQSSPESTSPGSSSEDTQSSTKPMVSGFIWPCPSSHTITSDYGPRQSPTAGASTNHKGIDIGAGMGNDILAAAAGEVIVSEYSESAGNYIIINHGFNSNGQIICSVYMHASSLLVSVGAQVKQGQTIAKVGSTGYSTGPHLHFAVTVDGNYVSPWGYVS